MLYTKTLNLINNTNPLVSKRRRVALHQVLKAAAVHRVACHDQRERGDVQDCRVVYVALACLNDLQNIAFKLNPPI